MKILRITALASLALFFLPVTGLSAREMTGMDSASGGRTDTIRPADYDNGLAKIFAETSSAANISSTAAGGLWSAPSTWAGGAVPQATDNVTIVSGATVVIDTAAVAANVTVGDTGSLTTIKFASLEGGAPAVLRFGETAAFSLTVAQNVTIGSNDTFSTGSGNANAHVLSVGGNRLAGQRRPARARIRRPRKSPQNTLTITTNITDLTGDWGVGSSSNPGAVSISGTVTTSGGQPIRNATLTLTGGNLPTITVQTGNFGTYSFTNLLAGETYGVRVDVKRYRFAQPNQIVVPNGNITDLNFVANPQE